MTPDESARLDEKARKIMEILDRLYPKPAIPLDHQDPFSFLVAVVLSAQSTDKKVNEVTPGLFAKAKTPAAMAALPESEIFASIKTVGLAPTKAKNIKRLAQLLVERHQGEVPRSFEALEALPGVGHKTASVLMSQAFGQPAFPVDTHIHRLAARWGLSSGRSVVETEADLKRLFPVARWNDLHLQIIYFGREHCPALRHDASRCPICGWAAAPVVASSVKKAPVKKRAERAAKPSTKAPAAKRAAKVTKPASQRGSRKAAKRGA